MCSAAQIKQAFVQADVPYSADRNAAKEVLVANTTHKQPYCAWPHKHMLGFSHPQML